MEPTKFENHIKETLKGSEIKPSEAAWHKIKGQIKNDYKPKRTGYFRYGIAAGFIGILILSVLYFTTDDVTLNQEVQVAAKPLIPFVDKEKEELLKAAISEEESVIAAVEDPYEADEEKSVAVSKKKSKRELVISEDAKLANTEELQNITSEDSNELIDTKIAEVLARVTTLEENNKELTDLEVDSLLRQAQKEILTQKLLNSDNTVNPSALLSQVEEEMDQSFRDQIFEKLKSGYHKLRTAVADRNN
ncbi:hypothetical protein [uncultured Eudoraea sp.]|uniref:hypothetical protein n=1 Tax=uncultured Eudoraea sp. TaxID=1035614 RepID=UPI002617627B|nr:hypothetical protein [uncultured Eudoraea sp.]